MRAWVPPPWGVLETTKLSTPSGMERKPNCFELERISPEDSSQFSQKAEIMPATASPSTQNTVSRHAGTEVSRSQWSAIPAPPMKPVSPSTISSLRWVRLLILGQVYQPTGWYQHIWPPAARKPLK